MSLALGKEEGITGRTEATATVDQRSEGKDALWSQLVVALAKVGCGMEYVFNNGVAVGNEKVKEGLMLTPL